MMTSVVSSQTRGTRDRTLPTNTHTTQPQKQIQPTAEQIRLAQMIYDKNDPDFEAKVQQLIEVTGKTQDECMVALHDCNGDVNRAILFLLESPADTNSWETVGKKKSPGKEGAASETKEKKGDREPSRGTSNRRGRGVSRSREGKSIYSPSNICLRFALCFSVGKAPPNLAQGVPPLLANQYIMGPGGLLPAYPVTLFAKSFGRNDSSSPAPATSLSSGGFINALLVTGLPYYAGMPGVPSAFQYGPTVFVPPASAKQPAMGLANPSNQYHTQHQASYGQHAYSTGKTLALSQSPAADYSKGGYGGSAQAQANCKSTITLHSFDKQGFHTGTPPPFSLPSALGGTGPLNPGGAPGYAPAPFLHILPPHQQPHSQLLHHHLAQDRQRIRPGGNCFSEENSIAHNEKSKSPGSTGVISENSRYGASDTLLNWQRGAREVDMILRFSHFPHRLSLKA
uniref:Ubiquitin associated protein 2b n=1 Tax=Neogobius melanostomus TaxID=47308 RepID=A0A8C6TYW4_9GOBI